MKYKEFQDYQKLVNFFKVQELFVFAYGSLMWRIDFPYNSQQIFTIFHYIRDFCVRSIIYRGTANFPGLVLGLKKSRGSCTGLLFSVSNSQKQNALQKLWKREMVFDAYIPTVLFIKGKNILTFVANSQSQSFCSFSKQKKKDIIYCAVGNKGSCLDYLKNTKKELNRFGVQDTIIEELL